MGHAPCGRLLHIPASSACSPGQAEPLGLVALSPSFAVMGTLRDFGFLDLVWLGTEPTSEPSPFPSCLSELNAQRAFLATFCFLPGGGATVGACFCSPTGCWTGSDDAAAAVVVAAVVVAVRIPQCFAVECQGCGIRPEWECCESDPEAASERTAEVAVEVSRAGQPPGEACR